MLDADAPTVDPALYNLGVPVLGICYGMQLTAHLLGGRVSARHSASMAACASRWM